MSSENSHNDIIILERAKKALNVSTDTELGDILGVKGSAIANWRARESINLGLIISKCESVNLNWLIRGQGAIHLKEYDNTNEPSNINYINEDAISYSVKFQSDRIKKLPIDPEEKLNLLTTLIDILEERGGK